MMKLTRQYESLNCHEDSCEKYDKKGERIANRQQEQLLRQCFFVNIFLS